jgi:hypothetical protein
MMLFESLFYYDAGVTDEPDAEGTTAQFVGKEGMTQRQARRMKDVIGESERAMRCVLNEIQEGTESTILNDKIGFIRELLSEKL